MTTTEMLVKAADILASTPDCAEKIADVYGLEVIDSPEKLLSHRPNIRQKAHISNKCMAQLLRYALTKISKQEDIIKEQDAMLEIIAMQRVPWYKRLFRKRN